ncbi:ganglioside-induced differentiation-associated protein 1 isoform X2 [Anthonomus grandis grandis]|uniref:ganglioside-induced differentiation-associated protein 1 isoform X2 n=1 Tax=Anthonomus grandis grandis TaxID=2921223 RepID=UPI0021650D02|nr:ganglioside-induced differentiation-associated protein 1 isoform X2 [Anthonomus grandis grandis]
MRKSKSFLFVNLVSIRRTLPLIFLLRKPTFCISLSTAATNGNSCSSASSEIASEMNRGAEKNGLLLYYNMFSFYSQKVVMALHEKNLPFETKDIDLNNEQQYNPKFLQINPKGEVPVLQNNGKIIADSAKIIDYLEDNFSNGDTPRLMPTHQNPEVRQKVIYFRNLIDKINGNVLTMGSFIHPEFAAGVKKVPFIAPVRNALIKSDTNLAKNLRKYAEENPEAREMLLEKAENQEKKREKLLKKEEFSAICNQTEEVFNKVEEELSQYINDKKNWWLCSELFTVADISLSILMVRIYQIGMEPYYWTNGKRPHCERYFNRVQERDSYKKTVPSAFSLIKIFFKAQMPLILGVSIATAIVIIIGGYFVVKKIANK